MRSISGAVVALLLTASFGSAGVASAQTQPPAVRLVTAEDVAGLLGGEWQGDCVHADPPVGPSDACTFDGSYGGAAQVQVVLSVGLPKSGEAPETWYEQTGITGQNRAIGAGDTFFVLLDDTAPLDRPRLVFRSSQAVGELSWSLLGEPFALPATADLAMLAMVRFAAQLGDLTSLPAATRQPEPSTDPLDTDQLEPDETPLPDGQLVNGDDLTLHLGGTWDDPGTCGVNIPDGASYLCQFSSIDVGGDPQTLMIWINRHGAGDGVSLESWRQTIEGRWREDSEAAPGAQTLDEISTVGDAAYLVTGTGDYAGSTLSFYDGDLDVRMQYTVDGPNGDPVSENQNLFLGDLGRLVAERLAIQAAAATDDVGTTAEPTEPPAPSAAPVVASAVPAPTAPPASPAPLPTAALVSPTSAPVVGPVQVAGPSDISLDPVVIATSVVAAAGIVLLIPFPSALFNSTLEQNYAEIRGWFRFRRRRTTDGTAGDEPGPGDDDHPGDEPGPGDDDHPGDDPGESGADGTVAAAATVASPAGALERFWATPVGAVSFFAAAGLLYGFLDPSFGFSLDSLLLYGGILAALAAGTLASVAALRRTRQRTNGERGSFHVVPATLLVALVCVLVTRITDFQPGYLYGVLAGLVFATAIGTRETGRENAITSSVVAGVGVLAFLVLGIVRALEGDGGATGGWIPVDVALSALVIGGFEGLLFGMLPLTGLPGATVKAWDTRIWALLLFLGTLGFLHIIVNPSSGYLVDSSRTPLLKALVLLVGFGLVSVGLWAWFRYRPMDRLRERRARRAGDGTPPGE